MADYDINAVTRRKVFTGSAGTGPYAFTFEILTASDIVVYFNATKLTLTTDFTVAINANGTGSVTLVVNAGGNVPQTPVAADQIVVIGARDIERTTDFVTAGDLLASSLNEQLDALTIFDQQIAEENQRGMRAPPYDPALVEDGGVVDMTLPAKASRAGKTLAFDSDGNPTVGEDIGNWRGDWAAGTAYTVRDLVKDPVNSNIYRVNTAHTSSGTAPISGNADVAKFDLVIDAASAADAEAAQVAAEAAQTAAETAQAAAETAETNAETAETNAETAETNAETAQTAAETAQTAAETAQTAAETAETNAETSETNAAASETAAASSASSASTSAATATTQAGIATTKAGEASTSATNAATSETNAATSESNASTSASNAATSESNAATSESNASTSASNAATSATNAATSESNAASSATASASSATASAASASAASTSESNASASESNAASSASSASTSAATATTQAGIATTKAGEASTSASNAASSATSASSAQTAAESARDATLAAYDNFDDRYLGTKSTAPTVDNDGNALVAGALYFDSVAEAMYVYTGSAWVAAYVSGTGFLALTGGTMSGDITFGDNDRAIFGADGELEIFSNGTTAVISETGGGDLYIRGASTRLLNPTQDKSYFVGNDGGASTVFYNGSPKLATSASGIDVQGSVTADGLTVTGVTNLNDTVGITKTSGYAALEMGGASGAYIDMKNPSSDDYDGRIQWNGSDLILTTSAASGGDVVLQHQGNNTKLRTTATGVSVTGTVTATAFSGDGSALTGISTDLVNDTTPQLGGTLDTNNNAIQFGASKWTIELSTNDLIFKYNGVAKIKFASDGQIVSVDDVTAFGTI